MIDQGTFVDTMSQVCAPVAVVTAMTGDGLPSGSTVSSLVSLSLDPPLVSFALDRRSGLLAHLEPGFGVGVNLLASHQEELASTFAGRRRSGMSKFDGVDWSLHGGLPYLSGSAGWIAGCVERHVDGGDHLLLVVSVLEAAPTAAAPLVYARRTFGTHSRLAAAR